MELIKEETDALFKFHVPDDWTDDQKRAHPLPADQVAAAARAGKALDIRGAIITGPLSLRYAEVASEVQLVKCLLEGDADFSYAHFKRIVNFSGTTFAGAANWNVARLAAGAFFDGTVFRAEARFIDAAFEGSVFAREAQFGGPAIFNRAVVAKSAFFTGCAFAQEADFISARIGSQADFCEAVFKAKAAFDRAQVEEDAFFEKATFEGEARFLSARIRGTANFTEAVFKAEALFEAARFQGGARFMGARFEKQANFAFTNFESDASFEGAVFEGPVHFNDTRLRTLFLADQGREPGLGARIDLRGCVYGRVEPVSAWKSVMGKLHPYDRQPYTQLEKTLREAGEDRTANEVYYARRLREAHNNSVLRSPARWLGDRLLRYVAGYGVWPSRLLPWFAAALVIGAMVFTRPGAVQPSKPTAALTAARAPALAAPAGLKPPAVATAATENPAASPSPRHRLGCGDAFWVTVDALLPVEIQAGEAWQPSRGVFLLLRFTTWATLLTLCGWVLVPVAIATLAGILKR